MVKYRFPGPSSWTFRLMGLKWVCISHQLSGVWGSTARNGHPLPDRPRHFPSVERGSRQGCHCVLRTVGQRRPGQGPCSQPRASLGLASASCSHPFWDHLPLTLLCLAGLPAVPITPSRFSTSGRWPFLVPHPEFPSAVCEELIFLVSAQLVSAQLSTDTPQPRPRRRLLPRFLYFAARSAH